MSALNIRAATASDAADLRAIYKPIVEETAISFETETPSEAEFAKRIVTYGESHAWLVAESEDRLAGYAYGSPHRPRAAYRYSAEVSAYVHSAFRGKGVGRQLYERLFGVLAGRGFHYAFAGITLPNPASVGLHEAVGFIKIGVFPEVGRKFEQWHDVGWWYRPLERETNK